VPARAVLIDHPSGLTAVKPVHLIHFEGFSPKPQADRPTTYRHWCMPPTDLRRLSQRSIPCRSNIVPSSRPWTSRTSFSAATSDPCTFWRALHLRFARVLPVDRCLNLAVSSVTLCTQYHVRPWAFHSAYFSRSSPQSWRCSICKRRFATLNTARTRLSSLEGLDQPLVLPTHTLTPDYLPAAPTRERETVKSLWML
jgi:hypothetical protein